MLTGVTTVGDVTESAGDTTDPAKGLAAVAALRRLLEDLEVLHVDKARSAGWTWRQVAEALGVTKQTVHRKHGKR